MKYLIGIIAFMALIIGYLFGRKTTRNIPDSRGKIDYNKVDPDFTELKKKIKKEPNTKKRLQKMMDYIQKKRGL